jgi:Ca2+-binding RTX toxin-like protein
MDLSRIYHGEVIRANPREIAISDGYSTTSYRGNFGVDYSGTVYGTLSGITTTFNGTLTLSVTGIGRDAGRFFELIDRGDIDAVYRFVLSGRDVINGSAFADRLYAHAGDDAMDGRGGHDALLGGAGADTMLGGAGLDRLFGEEGDDRLLGQVGDDLLHGGDGNDRLEGMAGNDQLRGWTGADILIGGVGNDSLDGGGGVDRLIGGGGRDVLRGGVNGDLFIFRSAAEAGRGANADVILDFSVGDRVNLAAIDADTTVQGNQTFVYIGARGFSGAAGELMSRPGAVWGDVNGDAVPDFRIALDNGAHLVASDILL